MATDLFYGVLSVAGQFASVLRERGKEYRKSEEGQMVQHTIEGLYASFNEQQKEVLNTIVSTLDNVEKMVKEYEENINSGQGGNPNHRTGSNGFGNSGSGNDESQNNASGNNRSGNNGSGKKREL